MKRYIKSTIEDDIEFNLEELNSLVFYVYFKNKYLYCCTFNDYNIDAFEFNMRDGEFADSVRELCYYYKHSDKFQESPVAAFMMSINDAFTDMGFDIEIFCLHIIISYAKSEFEQYLQDEYANEINRIFKLGHFVKITNLSPGTLVKDVDTGKVFIIGNIRRDKMNYAFYDSDENYVDTYQTTDALLVIPDEYSGYFNL